MSCTHARRPALWLGVMLLIGPAAQAADRRSVTEPALPHAVCATLSPGAGALQAALDRCPRGAAVRLSAGRYLSGPLRMPDGVFLWLDRGAVLSASRDPKDYDRGPGRCGVLDKQGNGCRPFILFDGVSGGGIVGDGAIDGQGGQPMAGGGESWWQLARRAQSANLKQNAPRLIEIDRSRDIQLYRVRLRNSPNFHVAMNRVNGVTVWGVIIDTPANARNTDGIDPGAATDVTIAHNFIRTGDDNVAIKAGSGGPSRYISIVDNHFYAGHGMSIGSETNGGVSDVLVKNLTLDGTTSGLRIKSDASRGGRVGRIDYQNVCLRGNRRPIDIDTRYDAHAGGSLIPTYQDVRLQQVSGEGGALVIAGYDAEHPASVRLDGVRFAADARWQLANARLSVGAGGVSPPPPGVAAPAATFAQRCDWAPFPVTAE